MSIVSFFDQFPEYNGVKFHFRGSDGYCKVSSLNKAMGGKRFADWMKTKFAQSVVGEISKQTGIPINTEFQEKGGRLSTLSSSPKIGLIDAEIGRGKGIWIHPYLVTAYALQDPVLYARVSIWLTDLMRLGTINPHLLKWTVEEYQRGLAFNRDDIKDMYQ